MKKEFKLSEKIWTGKDWACVIKIKDVKEFIRLCFEDLRKKQYPYTYDDVVKVIKNRAGEELAG